MLNRIKYVFIAFVLLLLSGCMNAMHRFVLSEQYSPFTASNVVMNQHLKCNCINNKTFITQYDAMNMIASYPIWMLDFPFEMAIDCIFFPFDALKNTQRVQ